MANFSTSNFLGTRSPGDRLMFIYNTSGTLVMSIDPFSSTFYNKGAYVYIMTDGVVNYNNVLDFETEEDAIAAVGLLNVQKKEFVDDANNAALQYLSLSGGTVIGDVNINGVLSATTIISTGGTFIDLSATTFYGDGSNLTGVQLGIQQYLVFNTGATVTSPVAGTIFYAEGDNAFSYKPYTVNNDVTINLGQESVIKVHNTTGSIITNGQVCHISGSHLHADGSAAATIELADSSFIPSATSTTALVSGVATHDIAIDGHGFITEFGLVRDINTGSLSAGETIYLSDTVIGGFTNLSGLSSKCSRANKIGRVLITGTTSGMILVDIQNENEISNVSQRRTNDLTINNASSGVISFAGLSINADTTKFDVGNIQGWLSDNTTDPLNPTITYVNYSGQTGLTPTFLATNPVTYIAIDKNLNIIQSTTPYTNSQKRDYIDLGVIVHSNNTIINVVNNQPVVGIDIGSQLYDLIKGLGFFNITGNIFSSNDGNLMINKSVGTIFKQGSNFESDIKNPHESTLPVLTGVSFRYRLQDSTEYSDVTDINPNSWDNNGVLTVVANNKFTVQRINIFSSNIVRVQYGQAEYGSMSDAIESIKNEPFVTEPNIEQNGLLRGFLVVQQNTTDLSVITRAKFIEANKFGSFASSGGVSTSDLQKVYNNSINPEILTDSTRGALTIKIGSGSNTDYALEVQNDSGLTTASINGLGTITATTYYLNNSQLVEPTFGEFYISGITITGVTDVYSHLTEIYQGESSNVNFSGNSLQIVDSGYYKINLNCSFSSSLNNRVIYGNLCVNAENIKKLSFSRSIGTSSAVGSASISGYIYLNSNDLVTFHLKQSLSNNTSITLEILNLDITRIK